MSLGTDGLKSDVTFLNSAASLLLRPPQGLGSPRLTSGLLDLGTWSAGAARRDQGQIRGQSVACGGNVKAEPPAEFWGEEGTPRGPMMSSAPLAGVTWGSSSDSFGHTRAPPSQTRRAPRRRAGTRSTKWAPWRGRRGQTSTLVESQGRVRASGRCCRPE